MNICVIGCGVSGLTVALRLLADSHAVTIYTREIPPNTTSDVAGAFWFPFSIPPHNSFRKWATVSYSEFLSLSKVPSTGVSIVPVYHFYKDKIPEIWWKENVGSFRYLEANKLRGFNSGFHYHTILIDSQIYMPYLLQKFRDFNGAIKIRDVKKIQEISKDYDLIVNCSGVWSHNLVPDPKTIPIRGQIVRIEKPPSLDPVIFASEDAYVVCRTLDCMLGGADSFGDWNSHPVKEDRDNLLQRCQKLFPEIGIPKIIEDRVGLRPFRDEIRLSLELLDLKTPLIHNYGHGGSGYTASWGCAEEVSSIVKNL